MTETDMVVQRASGIADQIPRLTEALGCVDCSLIFRHGSSCPFCESRALLNVADLLTKGTT